MNPEAAAFAARLAAQGIELFVQNDRLKLWPGRAYKTLPDEDRAFLRHHRAELKELVGLGLAPPAADLDTPTPLSAPRVPVCEYCVGPCVGDEHDAFSTLHFTDPAEVLRRDQRATAAMYRSMQLGGPAWT